MVKKEGSKYYVMPPSERTDSLREQAAADYAKVYDYRFLQELYKKHIMFL